MKATLSGTAKRPPLSRKGYHLLERKKSVQLAALAVPGLLWFFVFCYIPMAGSLIAFQSFKPKLGFFGSKWIGFDNFRFMLSTDAARILWNTMFYNFASIFIVAAVSVIIALLMDAVTKRAYLKCYQTLLFLPRFISWVVAGYMAMVLFHYERGLLNQIRAVFGAEALRVSGDISGSAAASFFQSVVGFVMIMICNMIVSKVDSESSLF